MFIHIFYPIFVIFAVTSFSPGINEIIDNSNLLCQYIIINTSGAEAWLANQSKLGYG